MAGYMRQPPRFVPTLTEVVVPVEFSTPAAAAAKSQAHPATDVPPLPVERATADAVVEQMTAQLMQRVDVLLQERLRYALSEIVQLQSQTLVAQLLGDIESVVRQSVVDAVAQELEQPASDS